MVALAFRTVVVGVAGGAVDSACVAVACASTWLTTGVGWVLTTWVGWVFTAGVFAAGVFATWVGGLEATLAIGATLGAGALDVDARIVAALAVDTDAALATSDAVAGVSDTVALFTELAHRAGHSVTGAALFGIGLAAAVDTYLVRLAVGLLTGEDTLAFATELSFCTCFLRTWVGDTLSFDAGFTCGAAVDVAVFADTLTVGADQACVTLDQGAEVGAASAEAEEARFAFDRGAGIAYTDTVVTTLQATNTLTFAAFGFTAAFFTDCATGAWCVFVDVTVTVVVFAVAEFGLGEGRRADAKCTVFTDFLSATTSAFTILCDAIIDLAVTVVVSAVTDFWAWLWTGAACPLAVLTFG